MEKFKCYLVRREDGKLLTHNGTFSKKFNPAKHLFTEQKAIEVARQYGWPRPLNVEEVEIGTKLSS